MKSETSLYDLQSLPFSRKNSFISIHASGRPQYDGKPEELYLTITKADSYWLSRKDLIHISLAKNGVEIPFTYTAGISVLRLDAESGGYVEFCIDKNILRARGFGVTLRFRAVMELHELACSKEDGTWEIGYTFGGKFLFVPLKGLLIGGAEWLWQKIMPGEGVFEFSLDESGCFEAAVHEYLTGDKKRVSYEPFEVCALRTEADYLAWASKYPQVSSEFKETRNLACYIIWSHLMNGGGFIKNQVCLMARNTLINAFGWQQSYQAMALMEDTETAWDFLLNMFAYQLPNGQIPDMVSASYKSFMCTKPPFQGFAALWVLSHAEKGVLSRNRILALYEPMCRWANWWFDERDTDGDGIPQYNHGDESGWDDASIFSKGVPVETPDLSAFLVLLTEALSLLAGWLGKDASAKIWREKSENLLSDMLAFFWDGKRFSAKLSTSHEQVESDSIALYQPIILGKRLPQKTIDTLADTLKTEGEFLSQHGLVSERLSSPQLSLKNSFCRGHVLSPVQLMMAVGLYEAGEKDLAKEVALRFCRKIKRDGFSLSHYPFDSEDLPAWAPDFNLAFGADIYQATSWTAAVFLVLAGFILE